MKRPAVRKSAMKNLRQKTCDEIQRTGRQSTFRSGAGGRAAQAFDKTAALKRRALKKKAENLKKNAGKVDAIPAILLSFRD
jgi:hypothetical protein